MSNIAVLNEIHGTEPKNATETFKRSQVQGSPFLLVGNDETGYFVTFGKYRITEVHETEEEALDDLNDNRWNIVATLAGIIAEETINANNKK